MNQIAFINSSIMLHNFLRISHPKSNYVSQMRCDEIEMTILTLQSTLPTTWWTSSSSTKAFIHFLSITGHQQVRRNFWCSTKESKIESKHGDWWNKVEKNAQIIPDDVVKIVFIHPTNNSHGYNNNQIVIIFYAASQFMATASRIDSIISLSRWALPLLVKSS